MHRLFENLSEQAKDFLMRAQTLFMGIMALTMLAGVPWAYNIGARVAVMETNIRILASASKDIVLGNSSRIDRHEERIDAMEMDVKLLRQYAEQNRKKQQERLEKKGCE